MPVRAYGKTQPPSYYVAIAAEHGAPVTVRQAGAQELAQLRAQRDADVARDGHTRYRRPVGLGLGSSIRPAQ